MSKRREEGRLVRHFDRERGKGNGVGIITKKDMRYAKEYLGKGLWTAKTTL